MYTWEYHDIYVNIRKHFFSYVARRFFYLPKILFNIYNQFNMKYLRLMLIKWIESLWYLYWKIAVTFYLKKALHFRENALDKSIASPQNAMASLGDFFLKFHCRNVLLINTVGLLW